MKNSHPFSKNILYIFLSAKLNANPKYSYKEFSNSSFFKFIINSIIFFIKIS